MAKKTDIVVFKVKRGSFDLNHVLLHQLLNSIST